MNLYEEFKLFETMWDTLLEWKLSDASIENTQTSVPAATSGKTNNTESRYVLAVDCWLDSDEPIDVYDLEFYRWGVEQDIGYEIADYDDLIDGGDKRETFDEAIDRAKQVLAMTDADEVYIIHTVEDANGDVISAECVNKVDK